MTLDDSVLVRRPIIAPLVILPMPGLPRYGGSMDAVLERAIADLEALEAGGVDGITLENMGAAPFFKTEAPPESVAAFAAVAVELKGATALPGAATRRDA